MSKARIVGQVHYMGPDVAQIGLGYGNGFLNGVPYAFDAAIAECPAIGEMFIPNEKVGECRRQLNLGIAREMRGTSGKYVAMWRLIQEWLEKTRYSHTSSPETGNRIVTEGYPNA